MGNKKNIGVVIVSLVLGFMLAIQFNTVKEPDIRDTRDIWELREDLLKEKEIQSRLLSEIRSNEEKLAKYETQWKQSREQALKETLDELKKEAGLTNVSGPGIILNIVPLLPEGQLGEQDPSISPELLQRLINELNMYGAKHLSIDNQRVVQSTVIRDVNGETKIDGYSLRHYPLEIKIITENAQTATKLYNRMQASNIVENLYIDNLRVEVMRPTRFVEIPSYEGTIRIRDMETVE